MLLYPVGASNQHLLIDDQVLQRFKKYQQKHWYQKEAGGQLFARVEGSNVIVAEATGPRRTDKRTRFGYLPDRAIERDEITQRHASSLHYVGDWHTHPQRRPLPSSLDLQSIAECVMKSRHHLNAFVLIVVGTEKFPNGLSVLVHDGQGSLTLSPEV
jgi:integrative and conjugative element protein (TIGR02256 family)